MNVWSMSRLNGSMPENKEKKPITMSAVCARPTTPPSPHVQPLNLTAIYAKITIRAMITAMMASRVMSFAMVGPTLSELMIPLGFSRVDLKSSREKFSVAKNPYNAL